MVLMTGSKKARNQASIINRPSCGGPKKAGLATYIGLAQARSTRFFCLSKFNNCYPTGQPCPPAWARMNLFPQAAGGVGKMSVLASRG